jgi:dipeptidyl aminopeptidase/acylaminoacyl peptidase
VKADAARRAVRDVYLRRRQTVTGGFASATWIGKNAALVVVENTGGGTSLSHLDVDTRTVRSLAEWSGQGPPVIVRNAEITVAGQSHLKIECDGMKAWLSLADRSVSLVPPEQALRVWQRLDYLSLVRSVHEQLSPDGKWLASIQASNVVIRERGSDTSARRITSDGTPDLFWDIEAQRTRILSGRRFSYRSVTSWSPDSTTLLAYRRDIRDVFRIPVSHQLRELEHVEYLPFQKAGTTIDRIQPVFIDVASGALTPVRLTDVEDRYVQLLTWHPNGDEALIIVYTRELHSLEIFAADRRTGQTRLLLAERSETFLKIFHDAVMGGEHGFRVLPDGSGFLWISACSGWNHLYRYDDSGRLIARLTDGDWPVHEIVHISKDHAYFTASPDTSRPYDVHVCRAPLERGAVQRLTHETGIHSPVFAPGGAAFLNTHSAVSRPTRTDLVAADGSWLREVSRMEISGLQAVGYVPPEEFQVKAADGVTDLWGVLYRPFDFDESRVYPVIHYVYGGPQTIETPRYFAMDPSMMQSMRLPWALAQIGYIVICLDARGTPGRSKAFHDEVCRNWNVGVVDQTAAVRQLCARHSWMDAERVGLLGHSWGGYFATAALLRSPDIYRTAACYAPAYDPKHSILYEPYLGLPATSPAAYEEADVVRHAARIERPLMMLVGTSDNHVYSTTLKMARALVEAGVDHELVVVPEGLHHFTGAEEEYLLMKLERWFGRHVRSWGGDAR